MLIDITQGARIGVTYSSAGPPALKVAQSECAETIDDGTKVGKMARLSCGVHNTGTHIDTMGEVDIAPDRFIRPGVKFDVSHVAGRQIELEDLDISVLREGQYVFFQTNWDLYRGDDRYLNHPGLSQRVLDYLISRRVNMIGIDAPGIGKSVNHPVYDSYAAEHTAYIIGNLTNLWQVPMSGFSVYCFPLKFEALDAIPARILVEVTEGHGLG
jgi:kynurenine formamidase